MATDRVAWPLTGGEGAMEERAMVVSVFWTPGTWRIRSMIERLTIACGDGAVRLLEVQRAGKGPARAADFLRGVRAMPETAA